MTDRRQPQAKRTLLEAAVLLRRYANMLRDSETNFSGPHKGQITDRFALAEVEQHERVAKELTALARRAASRKGSRAKRAR